MDLRSAVNQVNKLRERDIYMKLNTKEVENWLCRTVMRVIPICKENKEISIAGGNLLANAVLVRPLIYHRGLHLPQRSKKKSLQEKIVIPLNKKNNVHRWS